LVISLKYWIPVFTGMTKRGLKNKKVTLKNGFIQDRIKYLRENTDFVPAVFDSLIGYAIIGEEN